MKRTLQLALLLLLISALQPANGQVAIGTGATAPTPNPNAVLLLVGNGTNQGLIIPSVTSLSGFGSAGMVVYNSTSNTVHYHNGTAWNQVGAGGSGSQGIQISGNNVSLTATPNAGFGLASPAPTVTGQLLVWNGTGWESTPAPTTNGQTLSWNQTTGKWTIGAGATVATLSGDVQGASNSTTIANTAGNNIAIALNNAATTNRILESRITPSGTNNQVLTTVAGVTQWANATGGTLPSLSANQLLSNNGSNTGITVGGDLGLSVSGTSGTFTIANNAITTAKINNGAVTIAKIGTAGVPDANKILSTDASGVPQWTVAAGGGDMLKSTYDPTNINGSAFNLSNHTGQISTTQITDGSVTNIKLATGIDAAKITAGTLPGTVLPANVLLNSSTAGGELSGTLAALSINNDAITTTKINNGAVTIAKIGTAGVPDANKILSTDASGVPQWTVAVGGGDMLKSTYDPTNINGSAFNLAIHTGQITTAQITDANVTNIKLATGIDAAKITTGLLPVAQIPGLDASKISSGTLPVALGGTGTTTLSGLALGNGTSPFTAIATGINGQILTVSGGNPTWQNAPAPSGSAGGDLLGSTYPNPVIAAGAINSSKLANNAVATINISNLAVTDTKINDVAPAKITAGGATSGQVLKFNGTNWIPQADNVGGGGAPTLNPGQIIVGDGTSNSAATVGQDATLNSTNGNITVQGLRGISIDPAVPVTNSVYQYDGIKWTPVVLAGGGTVSNIATGTGLAGGPITATGTISIAPGGVGTTELAANSVTNAKIPAGAVTTSQLLDGTVADADISASAAIAVTKLATGTNGQVLTVNAGVPSWQTSSGLTNPMTTAGDIIYGGVAGVPTRLATGTGFLKGGATPTYSSIGLATTDISGILPVANGGTGAAGPWNGLLLGSGTTIGDISTGINGQILRVAGTTPTWSNFAVTSADITDGTIANVDVNAAAAIAGTKINPAFGAQNISTTGTLTTGTAGAFAVNATGNITKINGATTSFPAANAAGVLTNDGTGTLTWAAGGSGWGLTGNSGTNPATNFLGTTDAQPLRFATGVGGVERMRIDASGKVGIGTVSPNAPLQFANAAANRKIVLSEVANNDHQFFGFGLAASEMRYQLGNFSNSHVFYGGVSSTTSAEMMRIGNGYVSIGGRTTPINANSFFDVQTDNGSGFGGMYVDVADPDGNAFYGYSNLGTSRALTYMNATSGSWNVQTAGSDRLSVTSTGNVGIGTTTPTYPLDIKTPNGASAYGLNHSDGTIIMSTYVGSGGVTGGSIGTQSNHPFFIYTANGGAKLTVLPNGNVGIGATTPTQKLHVIGNILASGTITPSDSRLKENINDLNYGIREILRLRPVSYNWKTDPKGKKVLGLIAQETVKITPEVIELPQSEKDFYSMNYVQLIPVLIKAAQELNQKNESLEKENNLLKAELATLKQKQEVEMGSVKKQLEAINARLGLEAKKD
ncbi:MAG: hypothetical protein HOP37_10820 [Cyclobacteriaceae bacterium]|nr:hypothetical protein [Cyclobacteriaceae bacterium]